MVGYHKRKILGTSSPKKRPSRKAKQPCIEPDVDLGGGMIQTSFQVEGAYINTLLNHQNLTEIIWVASQPMSEVPVAAAGTSHLSSALFAVAPNLAARTGHSAFRFPQPYREDPIDPFLVPESDNILKFFFFYFF
jgi:hypothetical protein